MKTPIRFACGLAVILVLGGCSAEPAGEEPEGQGQGTPTSVSTAEGTAPAGGGAQLSAEQLEAVLVAINEAESLNAQVVPGAELDASQEEGVREAADITVTPEECNVYAVSSLESLPGDASRASMTFAGESSLQPDTISLLSLRTEEAAMARLQASRSQLDGCSEFTMEVSDQVIMATVEELPVETAAEEELALRTTATAPGTVQESLTVTGVVASTTVDILVAASPDPDADIARAERLMDLVVAELRTG